VAEINTGKKGAPRVDLTAMVDLAFLLITFFMLVTTFSKPKTMEIIKPAKPENEEDQPPIKQSKTLSLLLGERDKVLWYVGADDDLANIQLDSADYSKDGIRKVILRRQQEVERQWKDKNELIVLIKAMPTARYKNMVDILDEMNITGTKKFALVDMDGLDSLIAYGPK
jgi:biopolymer transport protein ExbD